MVGGRELAASSGLALWCWLNILAEKIGFPYGGYRKGQLLHKVVQADQFLQDRAGSTGLRPSHAGKLLGGDNSDVLNLNCWRRLHVGF